MTSHFPDGLPPVLPATVAQIRRKLPASGDILVRAGSRVEPDDLVGQCTVSPRPILIDVATALDIEPQDVPKRIRRKIGERVAAQQLLAKRGSRKCSAPVNGTLSAIDRETGIAVITPEPVQQTLRASVRGYVADVTPGRSVLIETAAAVIQGMFGLGSEQFGVLRLLTTDRHDMITPELIDARSAYAIIIGGAGITADALRKAQQEQIRGVIVGGIDQAVVREVLGEAQPDWYAYGQQPLAYGGPTLMITEGFGIHPMAEPLFDLLTRFDRQEAFLDGTTTLTLPASRPRLVIPLPRLQSNQPENPTYALHVGSIVRLVDERHLGMIGRVTALNEHGQLASGVRTATVSVQIGQNEALVLPQSAVEVIS